MTSGRGATTDWTSYNYPSCIRLGAACTGTSSDYSSFSYTPDRQYWKQVSNYTSGGTATTLYIGGLLEKVTTASGTDYRHMIRAGGSTIIVSRQSSGTNSINYVTSDHLGSSSAITNSAGSILVNSSFDAFGKRRGSNWSGNPSAGDWTAIASTTRRGFTEHTMLDNLNLTHMNGRVYDQMLGRFLSADPFVPHPRSTQSFNRFSYVRNGPLSFVDPSGFEDLEEILVTGARIVSGDPGLWMPAGIVVGAPDTGDRPAIDSAAEVLEEIVVTGKRISDLPPCNSSNGAKLDFTSRIGLYGEVGVSAKPIGIKTRASAQLDLATYNTPLDGSPYWSHGVEATVQIHRLRVGVSWVQRSYDGGLSFESDPTNFIVGDLQGSADGIDLEVAPPQIFAGFTAGIDNVTALIPRADTPQCTQATTGSN